MIERIEVDVGEKLAGLISEGRAAPPLTRVNRSSPGNHMIAGSLWVAVVDDSVPQARVPAGP